MKKTNTNQIPSTAQHTHGTGEWADETQNLGIQEVFRKSSSTPNKNSSPA